MGTNQAKAQSNVARKPLHASPEQHDLQGVTRKSLSLVALPRGSVLVVEAAFLVHVSVSWQRQGGRREREL